MRSRTELVCTVALHALLVVAATPLLAQEAEAPPAETPPTEAAATAEAAPVDRADLTEVNEMVRTGAYAEAEERLAAVQEEFPDDARILIMRGELLLALGRAEDALPVLRRCVEVDPERLRLHFQLATALQALGDGPGAVDAFAREIELNDDPQVKVMAHLNRYVLREQQKDWSGAVEELEAVLALDPARVEVYGEIASLYIKAGRLDDASARLMAGADAGFRSATHMYSLGTRYLKEKAYAPAAEAFVTALEFEPSFADAERNLGVALDQLGRGGEAVQHFRRYLELRPDAPDSEQIADWIRVAGGN
jgi:tetratricopeptide (TPR) repeat protein